METNNLIKENYTITGFENGKIGLDVQFLENQKIKQPIVLFVHGFKGFKDWGAFNTMAQYFAQNGLACLKFNFSRNGTTIENPSVFGAPESFGKNTYSIELKEIELILDWVAENANKWNVDTNEIYIAGHSRGASLAIIKAVEDERIKKVVAWAPFFDFKIRFRPETIAAWDKDGVAWVENKRTGEKLPLYRSFYEDFLVHQHRLDMHEVCANFEKPLLLLAAKDDEAVDVKEVRQIYEAIAHSIKIEFEHGGHTFGIAHPYDETQIMPTVFAETIENTLEFLID